MLKLKSYYRYLLKKKHSNVSINRVFNGSTQSNMYVKSVKVYQK